MAELSGKPDEAFRKLVKNNVINGQLGTERRIDIYHRNHIGARGHALNQVYAVCEKILGEGAFNQLVRDYIAQSTSNHWDLNFHGSDFAAFLQTKITTVAELADYFYLPELAHFEWAFHICYFAEANRGEALVSQDPDKLKFIADSSVQLLSSEWPVYQIWHNNRQNKGEQAVEDDQSVYYHLIYREALIPQIYALSAEQYQLIIDCIAGKTLTELAALHGEIVAENIPLFIGQKWLLLSD